MGLWKFKIRNGGLTHIYYHMAKVFNLKRLIRECIVEVIQEYGNRIPDPTKEEMMEFLQTQSCGEDGWEDDAEVAIYWFASEYHSGQWSNLYSALSTSEYTPGRSMSSIENEGDGLARMFYDALVAEFGGQSEDTNPSPPVTETTSEEEEEEEPLYVEYISQRQGENPFIWHDTKWEYVNARYPNGKIDIGVYSYAGDYVVSYSVFQRWVKKG